MICNSAGSETSPSQMVVEPNCDSKPPVFMFHDVVSGANASGYQVKRGTLEDLVGAMIARHPQARRSLEDTVGDMDAPLLTFDDGFSGAVENALPILRSAGVPAVMFVTINLIAQPGYATLLQLLQWREGGLMVGSHAVTHRALNTLDRKEALGEMRDSKMHLEDALGEQVRAFAFPGGNASRWLIDAALDGLYERVFTSRPGHADASNPIKPRFVVRASTPLRALVPLLDGIVAPCFRKDYALHALKELLGTRHYVAVRRFLHGI